MSPGMWSTAHLRACLLPGGKYNDLAKCNVYLDFVTAGRGPQACRRAGMTGSDEWSTGHIRWCVGHYTTGRENAMKDLPQAWRPPMGWNSWDSYGTTITEDEVLANARFMADHLRFVGWDIIVIDAAWFDPNARAHGYSEGTPFILDEYGRQLPDPARFPSSANNRGFGPLAERIHELGLRFGFHVMRGIPRQAVGKNTPVPGTPWHAQDIVDMRHVCQWNHDNWGLNQDHPGAQAWYDAQVDLFASWGIDFLKVDDMQAPFFPKEIDAYGRAIEKAERRYGRSIDLSLSPGTFVPTTHIDFLRKHAQMWRISDDLWDRWEDVFQQFSRLARWAPLQRTGHWADADMLPLGHIGLRAERGDDRQSRLTRDECATLLTLWAMGRSPLMVGGDLPTTQPSTIALMTNPSLREVTAGSVDNREMLRERRYASWSDETTYRGDLIVWTARACDWADGTACAYPGGYYVAIFWTGDEEYGLTGEVPLQSVVGLDRADRPWKLVDLWRRSDGAASPTNEHADMRITGDGAERDIVGTVRAHGVLWAVVEPTE